jgi:dipeptidyl aminopeptidase/acylaminoacyl peptidase
MALSRSKHLLPKHCAIVTIFMMVAVDGTGRSAAAGPSGRRPVTVADAIGMTKLGDPDYVAGGDPRNGIAQFSPDESKFVVVLRKGDLKQNTNAYSVWLWHTDGLDRSPFPARLLTMLSSSNRPAIRDIQWLSDNETIVFLGERPGDTQQVYTLNTRTKLLLKITQWPSSLLSYSVTADGTAIAFVAEPPRKHVWDKSTTRDGFIVGKSEQLSSIITGFRGGVSADSPRLYYQPRGQCPEPLRTNGRIDTLGSKLSLSPDGRYLLLSPRLAEIPELWKEYSDSSVRTQVTQTRGPGEASWLERVELIDTKTRRDSILLNSPLHGVTWSKVIWAADSKSVIISDVYLPLDGTTGESRELRKSNRFSVEVDVPSGKITEISRNYTKLVRWDARSDSLVFDAEPSDARGQSGSKVYFRKRGTNWQQVVLSQEEKQKMAPDILLQEDMNSPPVLVAASSATQRKWLLLDLNPQFRQLKFGKEEAVHWKAGEGEEFRGGLYYPVDYVPGERYPLVIQTHGFDPGRFWIDGPWTTAFAAQPLAGKDIMVLQADENYEDHNSPKEVDREVARLESAIDYLDGRGLIERQRVGIIGFSRTCLFVKYALTHSKYDFAAASVTDGMDGGYFQYLLLSSQSAWNHINEGINGGMPWGEGMESWMRRSPGFNVDKVRTPLRIMAENLPVLLGEWEWHAALVRLGKPVEMVVTKDADHILQKPWQRMVSQQGNVDWFAFWLKDQEDPDPAKAAQYIRWRSMRSEMGARH